MLVITGCTGRLGPLVAEAIARRGLQMRLLVRDPTRAPVVPGAEVVAADYGDPESLAAALGEGDRVFMVSVHEGPERRVPLHRSFVESAARAGVSHVVYLSFVNAGAEAVFLHARSHGATEAMLEASGLPWTFMRNGMYADELRGWFDAERVNRVPGGDGRMSFTYRPELAEAIAVVLTEPGHEGRTYDITTPDAVTMAELAEIAAAVSGEPFTWAPTPDDGWERRWREAGREAWRIEAGLTSYAALRAGELDVVSDDFRTLTRREPLAIREIAARVLG